MKTQNGCKECGGTMLPDVLSGLCPKCLLGLCDAEDASPGRGFSPHSSEQPGDVIGRYRLIEELGHGGFGTVWRAEQTEPVRREVAFKIIKLGMDTREVIWRFEAERQALAMMDHPGIAKVLDAGSTDSGRPYFVMEIVTGMPIAKFCDAHRLAMRDRLELIVEVCSAVQHAHQKGIIHRDIKPSNILVTLQDGEPSPRVIDFGIAKAVHGKLTPDTLVTRNEQFLGTPVYMSPEQANITDQDIDTRSDIYSLGVVLYEVLAGKPPFDLRTLAKLGFAEMRRIICEEDPPKPSTRVGMLGADEKAQLADLRRSVPGGIRACLRGDLDWIAMKAIDKSRSRRYATVGELSLDLQHYLRDEPVSAAAPSTVYRFRKFVRRNRTAVAVAALTTALIVAGVAGTMWFALEAKRHASETLRAEMRIKLKEADFHLRGGDAGLAAVSFARFLRDYPENRVAAAKLIDTLIHHNFSWVLCQPMHHDKLINSVEYDRDGLRLVSSSDDGTARLWDAASGVPIGQPLRHEDKVAMARFSPDASMVVTASEDGTARLWDGVTGVFLGTILKHDEAVNAAWFSPDGSTVVTASDDGTARLWSSVTGQPVGATMRHEDKVLGVQFSPDGSRLATVSTDHTARLWNGRSGDPVGDPIRHADPVRSVRFSPDGSWIATIAGNTAQVWDARSQQTIGVPMSHDRPIHSVEVSPDGRHLVTASKDSTVQIWDSSTGRQVGETIGHLAEVRSAIFSPDGELILTASTDQSARLWDSKTGRPIGEPIYPSARVHVIDFSPDGRRIALACRNEFVRIWDARLRERTSSPLRHTAPVRNARFSSDGRYLVTASADQTARVWDTQTRKSVGEPMVHEDTVYSAEFSPDGSMILTACADGTARIWDVATRLEKGKPFRHDEPVLDARFSPDGLRVVTGADDFTAQVWDIETRRAIGERMDVRESVYSVEFSQDGEQVLTGSHNDMAQIWDAQTGRPMGEPMRHDYVVYHANFSPDEERIVTASSDRTAQLWDMQSRRPFGEPMHHDNRVYTARFSSDGVRIVTASRDKTARLWDAETGLPMGLPLPHRASVQAAEFSPDGLQIVTACLDGAAYLWETEPAPLPVPEWVLDWAETVAGHRISDEGIRMTVLPEEILEVQERIAASPPDDFYRRAAERYFAEVAGRE